MAATNQSRKNKSPQVSPKVKGSAPLPDLTASRFLLAVAVWVMISIATHIPYLQAVHMEDDISHLREVGSVEIGMTSFEELIWSGANEHFSPAWKFGYYTMWKIFGLNPLGWHVAILIVHGVSAALLFFLLRHYLASTMAASVGAFFWAATAVGGWDNPLLYIAASHLPFGFLWLLAAMLCLSRYRSPNGTRWAVGMAACQTMAILNMGAMWVLTPILPVQYLLLEHASPVDRKRFRPWLLAWLVPFLVLGAVQMTFIVPEVKPMTGHADSPNLVQGTIRAAAEFQTTLTSLWLRSIDAKDTLAIEPAAVVGVAAIVVLFLVPRINRRLLLVVFGLTMVYTILVHTMRAGYSADRAMLWGRYAYVPLFAWSTAAAALTALPQLHRSKLDQRYVLAVLAIVISLFAVQQFASTHAARDAFDETFSQHIKRWEEDQRLFHRLAARARADNRPVRLTEFPLWVPPVITARQLFGVVALGEEARFIEFVSPQHLTTDDRQRAIDLLYAIDPAQKNKWYESFEKTAQLSDLILSIVAVAEKHDQVVRIPNLSVTINKEPKSIRSLCNYVFFEGLPRIKFVEKEDLTPEIAQESQALLKEIPGGLAREFERLIAELIAKKQM